jgi:hypothetical protein
VYAFYGGIPLSLSIYLRRFNETIFLNIKEKKIPRDVLFIIKNFTYLSCRYSFFSAPLQLSFVSPQPASSCHIIHNYMPLHNVNHNLSFACNDKSWFIDKNIHLNVYNFCIEWRERNKKNE